VANALNLHRKGLLAHRLVRLGVSQDGVAVSVNHSMGRCGQD